MKHKFCLLIFIFIYCSSIHVKAQTTPIKIAVFAPVYIDSAFNGNEYKLGSNNLPKIMLQGLEFYNGVTMAVDSLQNEGKRVEVLFYDSKGSESIYTIIRKPEFENIAMIIAMFNNRNDVKPLAEIALHRNIPLISATYPNEGGVTANPFFVMINSSIKTHCEEIYKYLQRYYSTTNIVYIKKKGALEDMLLSYFSEAGKVGGSLALKYKTVELSDAFTPQQLTAVLDSNKQNTVICGSLNEPFGIRIVKALSANRNYSTTAIGMPTWDGLKELDRSDCGGVNIVYSTPYNFIKLSSTTAAVAQLYKAKFNAKPSDMFFKGYESMYHFTSLLIANPNNIMNHLSDKTFKLFNDFDIQPINNKTDKLTVDYLENKKLYFIRKLDGNFK